jgi:carboxyl-terminal processing protease
MLHENEQQGFSPSVPSLQAVLDLDDGSALFVTVAKYQTPSHADIDQRGIKPDINCSVLAVRVGEESDVPVSVPTVCVLQVSLAQCIASSCIVHVPV